MTQRFWQDVEKWLKCEFHIEHSINNAQLIVVNIFEPKPLIETVILNAKYYIYKCFLRKCIPKVEIFKGEIKELELVEEHIAKKKNLVHIHNRKWNR